jgi:ribosomal protein S18 acetylase RimI-like enzyme
MLSKLQAGERERLVTAMREVERLLQSATIDLSPDDPDSPDALWCLEQYFEELAVRFDGGFDPGRGGAVADREMAPPTGLFLLARRDGAPVGCAGLKLHPDGTAEVKRMWVSPNARGVGLARRMLRELESHARASRATTLRLDTNGVLKEAQALYRREGFAEIPRFNDNPTPTTGSRSAWPAPPQTS